MPKVTAKDYEIEIGSVFDVKSDYTGLEIKDDNKVKVTFEEAKNDKDEDFTTDHADTYKAVYYVEPVNQEHPKYQISRKLIVREKATEAQTETAGSEAVTESETAGSEQQTEEAEDSEADSEVTDIDADEFDDLVEQAQNQDTYDEESGLELHDVLEQAGDEGVDLDAMEEGEIATFEAVSAYSARSTQQVTIEKGPLYRYADYNLGTYLTEPYYISYGSVRATAYCVQPAKPGPGSGNYTITKIGDNQALAKVCYYGTDAAGSESFFANKHTDFSEGKRFIIIHMAASYANGSSDAFYGTNATGEALAKELYNYCVNKPEIPDVAMSFSKPDVKAYVDGNVQRTENIKFNASSQQKITMDLPKGVKGTVEHLFEYVTGSLTDVTFDVFAAEDIKAADGVSEDYFKADEKVGTITTDSNGIAQMGDLPAGKYYVKEVKTAHGYVLDKEPRYVDLSYRDQDTPVITYDEKWQNARQKVKVTVLKKEKDTDRVLAGGVFGLYTSEDIKNAKGEVLLEKDSLIEQRVTDEKGQITFTADLPVDGKYYVKEIFAPDGFVTTEEVQEFTFEYAGEDQAEVSYDFTFENQPTTVELSKTDLTTGKELPGAHLKVTDSDGNTVDEWTSTEESHVIKELVVGKEYTMTETKPADGYVTAESITFTVENTAEIQKVEMKDDVTKVEISKTDITGETEIPGAKLTILDKDDQVVESWTSTEEAHYIEKLPIGKYTLREEQAPKGYLLTADVTFEVKDTGEIQKVAMKDDTAKGKVILNKTDKSSGEPLKGVEFELRDSKGKVLETLKTDAAGHAESKLYEIATFKNGKYDTAIKYYLVETKTLDGYTLDQTKHEVTFAYANDSTPVVEVTFNLTNEKPEVPETPNTPDTPQSHEETKVSNAPKTGDSTNIWLPILLLVISTGGMAGLYICRKRKNK